MATSPRIPRSPSPAASGSWWRQPSISAHPQNMNNADIFGNPLLWLPHEQEHLRPHENLTYHNSAPAYRNFDFLNGSSPSSYYASTPRFFPEPAHSLHSMSGLGKDRPLTWEDRIGGHGLMLDVSGNGFSPWQDMHQQKMVDRQQKQIQESVEKERTIMGLTNNRASNYTDNNLVKSVKQSNNKYLENSPTISNNSRVKVQESCLNVPVISNDSRHNIQMSHNSRLNLLGMPNDSHLKVSVMSNEPHLKIPPISSESSFNIASLSSEPKLDIPSITSETQLNDALLSDDTRHVVTSSSEDGRHGITSIIGQSRLDVPMVAESRLNTPPLLKEPQQSLTPLSQQNIPPLDSETRKPQENQHRLFEKPFKYSHADARMPIGNIARSQPERNVEPLSTANRRGISNRAISERPVSPPKPDLPVNMDPYEIDTPVNHDQYKRDTVINSLESDTNTEPPLFSPPALVKSVPGSTIMSSKPSGGLPSPIQLHETSKTQSGLPSPVQVHQTGKPSHQSSDIQSQVKLHSNSKPSMVSPSQIQLHSTNKPSSGQPSPVNLYPNSKHAVGMPSPVNLHPARPTGGKPPLLERFRAPAIARPGGDSSSDGASSDGDDEDGESGSESDTDDDGVSDDANDDDDNEDDDNEVTKQSKQSLVQQLAKPLQPQELKQPQHVVQQVFLCHCRQFNSCWSVIHVYI